MMRALPLIFYGILCAFGLYLFAYVLEENGAAYMHAQSRLTQEQERKTTLQTQIQHLDHDIHILDQEKEGYAFLMDHKVMDPLNRLILVETLKRQGEHYGFEAFHMDISPVITTDKPGFKVHTTPLKLTFIAKTDLETWSFLDTLQDKITGLVTIEKLILERGEGLSMKNDITLHLTHLEVAP